MGYWVLIALCTGIASAIMSLPQMLGTPLGIALALMAAMPLYVAGLGWGWRAALVATVVAALIHAVLLGTKLALFFLLGHGVPAIFLCYLVLLSRVEPREGSESGHEPDTLTDDQMNGQSSGGAAFEGRAAGQGAAVQEWYPVGRLVGWIALFAGLWAGIAVLNIGNDYDQYRTGVEQMLGQLLDDLPSNAQGDELSGSSRTRILRYFVAVLPAAVATASFLSILLNFYIGARIIRYSGRLRRPWPNLAALEIDRPVALALVAAMMVSMLSGLVGVLATGFAASFLLAYALVGFAIAHVRSRGMPLRPLLLTILYGMTVILNFWVVMFMALIGLGDQIFNFRRLPKNRNDMP